VQEGKTLKEVIANFPNERKKWLNVMSFQYRALTRLSPNATLWQLEERLKKLKNKLKSPNAKKINSIQEESNAKPGNI
jgi:hypothetical protein